LDGTMRRDHHRGLDARAHGRTLPLDRALWHLFSGDPAIRVRVARASAEFLADATPTLRDAQLRLALYATTALRRTSARGSARHRGCRVAVRYLRVPHARRRHEHRRRRVLAPPTGTVGHAVSVRREHGLHTRTARQ